jgi:hypothetical protein
MDLVFIEQVIAPHPSSHFAVWFAVSTGRSQWE